jgi:hypothetical protein
MPFRPLVHVGWHLAFDAWHHGYATEGAQALLQFAFDVVGLFRTCGAHGRPERTVPGRHATSRHDSRSP